jgi:phosphoserine phosphatase RsbU/P
MAGLIDNLMDFARGQLGGGLPLDLVRDAEVQPVVEQVLAETRIASPTRVIHSELTITETVTCDPGRIGQLLSNLLANALTHGDPAGPVWVRAHVESGAFELSVANIGEPIPPPMLDRLFQPFVRGAVRPGQQGLGLGLYIASEIARAHGGSLHVTSSPEETRFTFRFDPASVAASGHVADATAEHAADIRA